MMPLQGQAALVISTVSTLVVLGVFLLTVRHEKKNDSMTGDDE